jgi:hypothetical protein
VLRSTAWAEGIKENTGNARDCNQPSGYRWPQVAASIVALNAHLLLIPIRRRSRCARSLRENRAVAPTVVPMTHVTDPRCHANRMYVRHPIDAIKLIFIRIRPTQKLSLMVELAKEVYWFKQAASTRPRTVEGR